MRRVNLKNLNDVKVREEYHISISNTFAVFENLYNYGANDNDLYINRAWESARKKIKASDENRCHHALVETA
jgi:hypothetical protein